VREPKTVGFLSFLFSDEMGEALIIVFCSNPFRLVGVVE